MVVADLPVSVLVDVHVGVSGLDLVSRGAHGELVDAGVLGPVVPDDDVALEDDALGLLEKEGVEVVLDEGVVGPGSVGHGGQEDGVLGVPVGDLLGIEGGEGVVPPSELGADLLLGNGLGEGSLGHHGRVVVGNLPLSVLEDVDEGVAGLDLGAIGAHGEFVNTGILGPVGANDDIGLKDGALRLLLAEGLEVVGDEGVAGAGHIRHGGKEHSFLGVTRGNSGSILGGEGVVPEVEQVADLVLRDGSADGDALGHDTGMVVGDLPLAALELVNVRVTGADLGSVDAHGEVVNSGVHGPAVADGDLSLDDLALGLLLKEGIEVILDGGEVGAGGVRDSGEKDGILGVPLGDDLGIAGGECRVPEVEEGTDLILGDVLGDALGRGGRLGPAEEGPEAHVQLGGGAGRLDDIGAGDGSTDEGAGCGGGEGVDRGDGG
mmetsp:Transcript_19124/g.35638  ORF Transcript_19124/g.35638 Transcript_19124/m.35638 type:complete len:434 (-) Transcript_19124:79-1380(-)